jgi:hypothetical protein
MINFKIKILKNRGRSNEGKDSVVLLFRAVMVHTMTETVITKHSVTKWFVTAQTSNQTVELQETLL